MAINDNSMVKCILSLLHVYILSYIWKKYNLGGQNEHTFKIKSKSNGVIILIT